MEGALAGRRRARATVLAVGLASGSLLLLLVLLTIRTWQGPDIFYHLFLGRRILDGGGFQPADDLLVRQPQYVNLYWLFQVIAELLHRAGGVTAASLLFTAVWTAVCALWARAAGCLRRPAIGLPLALGAILILGSRFEPRPEAFSYLWLILQLGWLSAWDPTARTPVRFYVLFAASQALWANMHGYFVLGPLLVAARLAGAWLRREERSAWRRPALLLVLALAASCLSPFGWRTWAFAHTLAAFLRSVGGAITEFGPPTGAFLRVWTVKLFWVYWAGTLLIALLLLHRRGARPFALLVALAGLGLSAASARNLPLLPLLSAPLHAAFADWASSRRRGLAGWFARRARPTAAALVRRGAPAREGADGADRSPARPRGAGALVACGLTAAAALGLSAWIVNGGFHEALLGETRFGFGLPPHTYPLRFAAYLERHPAPGRVFNNAADGGYLEYRFPGLRVYMDSRYVDAPLVREYFAALVDPQAFARLHARQRFDGALLKIADSPGLVLALLGDPQWRLVYGDPHRAFFVARERAESGDWPVEPPLFFQGDDLARRVNGLPAIQWVGVLARGSDRALLLAALEQLSGAPRIPSYVIQYALQYGFERQDGEVLELASRMYPRMFALDTAGRRFVDALMRRLPSR